MSHSYYVHCGNISGWTKADNTMEAAMKVITDAPLEDLAILTMVSLLGPPTLECPENDKRRLDMDIPIQTPRVLARLGRITPLEADVWVTVIAEEIGQGLR